MSLIASIGAFLPALLGKELSYKAARIAGFITLGTLVIAILALGKCAYDGAVIEKHESRQQAKIVRKQLEADRDADAAAAETTRQIAETQKQIEQAARDAKVANPTAAAQPVGPVSQSYYDTLRNQKKKDPKK